MGYGGVLIWTALAHNLKKVYPNKKLLLIYKRRIRDIILQKSNPDFVIFANNPDIDLVLPKYKYFLIRRRFNKKDWIIVDMDNPCLHYWEKDKKEKIFYKYGKHAIKRACRFFKLKNILLKPILKLTDKESKKINKLLKTHNLKEKNFIVVEPNAKESFTPNKKWFWNRWQELVDLLKKKTGQIIVQVGTKNSPVLSGVNNLIGQTSFREAAGLIGKSSLFVGYTSGLMHAARAMNVKSVILVSGFESPELACYPENINIYKKVKCAPCGLKTPCPYSRKCMRLITVDEVYNNILKILK